MLHYTREREAYTGGSPHPDVSLAAGFPALASPPASEVYRPPFSCRSIPIKLRDTRDKGYKGYKSTRDITDIR